MTDITVYIPSHDYGRFLEPAIESVLRQTTDRWELLLFNDGSKDSTAEVMEHYRGDPRVRLFTTEGVGLAAVANRALAEARGKYLIRLDADDIFDENILIVLGNILDRNPGAAMADPDYYLTDEYGRVYAQARKDKGLRNNSSMDPPPNGACTMVRTEILRMIRGYREGLGAQDGLDIWIRISREFPCLHVNLPLFYYRRHGANLTENIDRIFSARRMIKVSAGVSGLDKSRPITAVIPCRRHYDFCEDVWNQKLGERTLLERAVDTCLASMVFDRIVVTSDNPQVADSLRGRADPRLSFELRLTEETIRSRPLIDTLARIVARHQLPETGIMVLVYVQAPFTRLETLEEAVHTLIISEADSAVAVWEVDGALFQRAAHGLIALNRRGFLTAELDAVYCDANLAFALKNRNLRTGSLTGARTAHYEILRDEGFFIDTKRSLEIARILNATAS